MPDRWLIVLAVVAVLVVLCGLLLVHDLRLAAT